MTSLPEKYFRNPLELDQCSYGVSPWEVVQEFFENWTNVHMASPWEVLQESLRTGPMFIWRLSLGSTSGILENWTNVHMTSLVGKYLRNKTLKY
jgi:hypothetical protein